MKDKGEGCIYTCFTARGEEEMEWRKCYLDVILVPLAFLLIIAYHAWLWYKVQIQPLKTIIGRNANGRRFWVLDMMKVSVSNFCVYVLTV